MHPAIPITCVFGGCGSNAVFLELLTRRNRNESVDEIEEISDPGSGIFITFWQFAFISLHGFIFTSDFGRKKRVIPIKHYITLVFLFTMANVTNNFALKFNISMPLHMIFRSGSLITNMIMGIFILNKKYTLTKYLSVLMITLGIAICTIVFREDSISQAQAIRGGSSKDDADDYFTMSIGVLLLTAGLILSSLLGLYQETLVANYGKHPQETLYYSHLLFLPGFFLLYRDLFDHAVTYLASEPFSIPILDVSVPILWLHLIGNCVTQYACISSVYTLQSECTSLTVTLVVTLRKFLSLLFSIFYFNSPFTLYHWAGTILVFWGTLMFMDIFKSLMTVSSKEDTTKMAQMEKKLD